ncbi:hypothetical protein KL86CLO1_10413 [uncultured Eubacteriales bacterium]|uniref:Uncharacterized protein n=1 Tax=uncultured Eubacteriales bacterium TaxID=172733 RepID=A0A212J2L8_9FIRM|nr:hypothetical protein KL86CLO1_10413 [uncultured Eubacteriales bacterium]
MRLDHLLSKETFNYEILVDNVLRSELFEDQEFTLFNLEGTRRRMAERARQRAAWGYSSAGRAPALQAGGHRFEPDYLHQTGP